MTDTTEISQVVAASSQSRHHLVRREQIVPVPVYEGHAKGFSRYPLVGHDSASVHMGLGFCSLSAGAVEGHVHSFEESFYVLEGEPVLTLGEHAVRLRPGACGIVPVGAPHRWQNEASDAAIWIDMLAPRPRQLGEPADTFFGVGLPSPEPVELDVRDPRNRNLFVLTDADLDLDALKRGSRLDAPTVSASMATALLAYSGIGVKMLVDKRLDAQLSTMFMVDYQPGAVAHPHDHPFEEAYYMLEGEIDVVADDARYTLRPGDTFWTGVGCVHAFYEVNGAHVRWLETSAPQPPDRNSYRFERDWDYLAGCLDGAGSRLPVDG
jgi:quercetin dioxygenase-like cupin family protein